jgi:hypothetical protein
MKKVWQQDRLNRVKNKWSKVTKQQKQDTTMAASDNELFFVCFNGFNTRVYKSRCNFSSYRYQDIPLCYMKRICKISRLIHFSFLVSSVQYAKDRLASRYSKEDRVANIPGHEACLTWMSMFHTQNSLSCHVLATEEEIHPAGWSSNLQVSCLKDAGNQWLQVSH